jgi:hypothetical protein
MKRRFLALPLALALTTLVQSQTPPAPAENTLAMPAIGTQQLRVLTPTMLELTLINTKPVDGPPAEWNFIGENFKPQWPAPAEFTVKVNGQVAEVKSVGFKRRPIYAPLKVRDLRIGNYLYLELAKPLPADASIEVAVPGGRKFAGSPDALRFNPAIHVNQVGYGTALPKEAIIGYYLGSLGELPIPADAGFSVIDAKSGKEVFHGPLTQRTDRGFNYPVAPYQQVYEADFSDFRQPGDYRIAVAGFGASYPFTISEDLAAAFARTYALGIYHQRCGMALELPFTRFTHDACHTAPAEIPTPEFKTVEKTLADMTGDYNKQPGHQGPRLENLEASLYPFVKSGKVDVTQGHHDAGDYSKYTVNSAQFIHYLIFAVDAFPGVGDLDNLGLPESGDGKSDVLQLAKWETDFLAKMQDDDGGFYFLVYPRDRKYEGDVLPENGDPQVVYPKTTAISAAAVAALAEAGSSPLFRKQFPADADRYLAGAKKGWEFLERAWAKYGRDGSYQKLTHYGNMFQGRDAFAWAEAEMFLATGDEKYQKLLLADFDPSSHDTFQWGWVRLSEYYGNAIRSCAFAEKSGRPGAKTLDPELLKKCREQIMAGANDSLEWSKACAYGTSFPTESKRFRVAGWYFAIPTAFDLLVAYQLDPRPELLDAYMHNLNFEGGANPNNVTFLTGLGWRRQREIVSQYAQNSRRILPPDGIPLGSVQSGFAYLDPYKKDLGGLTFPFDGDGNSPYPFYDRWGDSFNTTTEFVAAQQARGLAGLAYLMAQTPAKTQKWKSAAAHITGLPAMTAVGTKIMAKLEVDGLDLSNARVVWEARDQEPAFGESFGFTPAHSGPQWVEAEAQWPDGRRAFAVYNFQANRPDGAQPRVADAATKLLVNFDDLPDGVMTSSPKVKVTGAPVITSENLGWMKTPKGKVVRFGKFEDALVFALPDAVSPPVTLSARLYVERWPYGKLSTPVLAWAVHGGEESILGLNNDRWLRPSAPKLVCGGVAVSNQEIEPLVVFNEWQLYEMTLHDDQFSFRIDGKLVKSGTVNDMGSVSKLRHAGGQVLKLGNFIGYADELCLRSDPQAQ